MRVIYRAKHAAIPTRVITTPAAMNVAMPNFAFGCGGLLFVAGAGGCQLGRSPLGGFSLNDESCSWSAVLLSGRQIHSNRYGITPAPKLNSSPRNSIRQ